MRFPIPKALPNEIPKILRQKHEKVRFKYAWKPSSGSPKPDNIPGKAPQNRNPKNKEARLTAGFFVWAVAWACRPTS
jgi:hypothetical protein